MAVKQKCPEFENHERWLVSYADMVTLLFALFVVLFAQKMDCVDSKSDNKVTSAAIMDALNTPLPEIPVDRRVGPQEQGMGIFEHFRGDQARPPLIQKYPGSAQRVKIINNDLGRVKALLEERLYGPEKFPEKGKTGLERVVSVERTQKGFKLQLMARHFFEPGEYQVRRGAMSELNQVGQILMDLGRPIVIEGHTDSIPATGKYSNWELSSLRAASVGKYFVRQLNFPTSKMSVAGYADLRPVAPNTTDAGRAANRRIEIQVDYDPEVSSE